MEEIYIGKRANRISGTISKIGYTLIIVVLIFIFWNGVNELSTSNIDKQETSLSEAIDRDIIQCYCLEGVYPPSLDYLEQHYGLIYDKELFFVDYRPIGANIYPDVTIIRIQGDAKKDL
ncbi:hypothetical protein [Butyrivibrio sp. MB2005]|jgi:hypothetical protein|uniref:hypothetical protein n=1 Tax=Butyrivibrio sp. MB2005 TaxID=1280678 RepID=UPI00040B33C2|nr:hypothetical protein [Butyrivibrio sp. MB2005]